MKNIVGVRFKPMFDLFVKELEDYGYNVYWQVLNAKHYGIPQNRERVYCVIIRKDLDNYKFSFPAPIPLQSKLPEYLEDDVDEKYYLPKEKVDQLILTKEFAPPDLTKSISNTIRTGGRGSVDRHTWDLIATKINKRSEDNE